MGDAVRLPEWVAYEQMIVTEVVEGGLRGYYYGPGMPSAHLVTLDGEGWLRAD